MFGGDRGTDKACFPEVNISMCGADHGEGFLRLDHGFHADPGEDAFIVRPLQDRQAVLDGGGEGFPLLARGVIDETQRHPPGVAGELLHIFCKEFEDVLADLALLMPDRAGGAAIKQLSLEWR